MTAIAHPGDRFLDDETDEGETPVSSEAVNFIGVVSPMTSLGFAPFSYLGLVHAEGLVLSSAAYYQVTFARQQQRIVEQLTATPYAELSQRANVLVYPRRRIERAELTRQFPFTHRLDLHMRGGTTKRLVVQQRRVAEVRQHLTVLVGDAWTDRSAAAA